MNALPVIVTVLAAAPFVLLGSAKVSGGAGMPERAEHLGFSAESYRWIGFAELLGAAGLVVGLALPVVGLAAASCLLVLLGAAIVLHLRNGDGPRGIVPALVSVVFVVLYLTVRWVTR